MVMKDFVATMRRYPNFCQILSWAPFFFFFFFFLRDFVFKKTLFEKLQYLKQEQQETSAPFASLVGLL